MSRDTIRARVSFSFQGETYELDARIDLEHSLMASGEAPNFHLFLAKAHGIDPYSYLYEALESHEVEFSDATGIAVLGCDDGHFDWVRFVQLWREDRDVQVVRRIAEQTMGEPNLDAHAELKAALLAAYRAGKADGAG